MRQAEYKKQADINNQPNQYKLQIEGSDTKSRDLNVDKYSEKLKI